MKDAFILACREYFVKNRNNESKSAHQRKRAEIIPVDAIARRPKALGIAVIRAGKRHTPVRIPAMSVTELGHVLRTLEYSRAFA